MLGFLLESLWQHCTGFGGNGRVCGGGAFWQKNWRIFEGPGLGRRPSWFINGVRRLTYNYGIVKKYILFIFVVSMQQTKIYSQIQYNKYRATSH
jgi:hypothetical protein